MYYPESKILTDQYTDGTELVYVSTKQYYTGSYHILSNWNIFTGRNPRDGELQKLEYKEPILYNNANDSDEFTQLSLNPTNTTYDGIRKRQNIQPPNAELIEPKYSEPVVRYPSFMRYFLRRTNNAIFTEVSQIDFNAVKIRNPKYNYGIYIPFELPWTTSGINIAEINQKMTLLTEKRLKVYGLSKYITDYTEFSI